MASSTLESSITEKPPRSSFDSANGPSITRRSLFLNTRRLPSALGRSASDRTSTPAFVISVCRRVSAAFCVAAPPPRLGRRVGLVDQEELQRRVLRRRHQPDVPRLVDLPELDLAVAEDLAVALSPADRLLARRTVSTERPPPVARDVSRDPTSVGSVASTVVWP